MRNLNDIFDEMKSGEESKKIKALEESCDFVKMATDEIIQCFTYSSNPFLVAERLPRTGKAIIAPLEDLLKADVNKEIKILSALVLLKLGSLNGKELLLNSIENEDVYIHLILQSLAETQVIEAKDLIINRIIKSDTDSVDLLISLLTSLKKFTNILPNEIKNRFSSISNLPWQVDSILKEDWGYHKEN